MNFAVSRRTFYKPPYAPVMTRSAYVLANVLHDSSPLHSVHIIIII